MDIKKREFQKARLFSNLFWFIVDMCAINDHLESIRAIKIYESKYSGMAQLKFVEGSL